MKQALRLADVLDLLTYIVKSGEYDAAPSSRTCKYFLSCTRVLLIRFVLPLPREAKQVQLTLSHSL